MYVDINKGDEIGTGIREQEILKESIIKHMGLTRILFLNKKTVMNLIDWLKEEDYVCKVEYSLESVYSHLKKDGYRDDFNKIKKDLKNSGETISCNNTFMEELIKRLEGVSVYKVRFKYNYILDAEEDKLELLDLRNARTQGRNPKNKELNQSKTQEQTIQIKQSELNLNKEEKPQENEGGTVLYNSVVGVEGTENSKHKQVLNGTVISTDKRTLIKTIKDLIQKYKDFKEWKRLEGIQRYSQEQEVYFIVKDKNERIE